MLSPAKRDDTYVRRESVPVDRDIRCTGADVRNRHPHLHLVPGQDGCPAGQGSGEDSRRFELGGVYGGFQIMDGRTVCDHRIDAGGQLFGSQADRGSAQPVETVDRVVAAYGLQHPAARGKPHRPGSLLGSPDVFAGYLAGLEFVLPAYADRAGAAESADVRSAHRCEYALDR
jgi:hypothetical protein